MSRTLIIPIFVPHMGCPHTCVFCNQRKIAGSFMGPTAESVKAMVSTYRETFPDLENAYIELAFYGGSFTGIRDDIQENLLSIALKLKQKHLIDGIRLSTRPDYINPEVMNRLVGFGVTTVELGVQSMDDEVLAASQRGHTAGQVEEAVGLIKKSGIKVGIQLMLGLPKDNREKALYSTRRVIELNPDFVRIYPTVVIRETSLASLYFQGLFKPWTLETAIDTCAIMAILFAQADIPIIRMGLQATDNLLFGKDLIAGPYHPAFGELVKSRIFRHQIEFFLNEYKLGNEENELTLYCHPKELSQLKGQKNENITYFQNNCNIKLSMVPDNNLKQGSIAFMENCVTKEFSRREFLDKYRITY
ncbi:MAG: radical SAM protein [Clostridia bacterium]|nr:radical SAM protein [Clostridia bacterium]